MVEDFYTRKSKDFHMVKGDTKYLAFEFYDEDGNAVSVIDFESLKFNARNPITRDNETTFAKTHDDSVADGDGIYVNGDVQNPTTVTPAVHQLVVFIDDSDTDDLETGVYTYDLEMINVGVRSTIKGNLIISEEITTNA